MLLAALLTLGGAAAATPAVQAEEPKAPVTVQDHLDLAKVYIAKAATYRKEVAFHREMFAAYKSKSVPAAGKAGSPNPWVVKMRKHCEALIKDAETLAARAETAAQYHELRAAELQGR